MERKPRCFCCINGPSNIYIFIFHSRHTTHADTFSEYFKPRNYKNTQCFYCVKCIPHQRTGHNRQPQEMLDWRQRRRIMMVKSCYCCSSWPAPPSPPEASAGSLHNNNTTGMRIQMSQFYTSERYRHKRELSDPEWG